MNTIENEHLQVTIEAKGAELKTIFQKQHQLNYMWSGNPEFWGKTSPVLFPIVGTLKNNSYQFGGHTYHLPRHGFARDQEFDVTQQEQTQIRFSLASNETNNVAYPFPFIFSIVYTLQESSLSVEYIVENTGAGILPFSVGGHPAFKLPLVAGSTYDNYELQFEKKETAGRWPISEVGLIKSKPEPLLDDSNCLPLTKKLFEKDAVVLKHLASAWVKLVSTKTPHGLIFHFKGFDYLGLWAAPGADFICIEPWSGIADSVDATGNIMEKEGIIKLPAGESFPVRWTVELF